MNQAPGQVVPFDRSTVPAVRKEDYIEAIQLWCENRNTADALTREEIGAMDWLHRMDAQRKALILAFAHYLRKHQRSDVALGVQLIITLLSDNEHGGAQISQETMATLFGRSRTAIYQAQSRLKEAGLIVTGRGRHAKTYPVIPRAVTKGYNHLTWTISAICQNSVNCKDPASNSQLLRQTEQLNELPSPPEQLEAVNCQVEANSIAKAHATLLLTKTSEEERGRSREGAFGKVAAAVAAGFAALPMGAAAHPPTEQVQSIPAECWQNSKAQMDAAINPMEARAQKQVWVTGTGMLQVAGEFKAELLETYPLVDLVSGLSAACTNAKPQHGAVDVMKTIRRQFGYMQQDAASKEKRAGRAPLTRNGTNRKKTVDEMSADEYRDYLERGGV